MAGQRASEAAAALLQAELARIPRLEAEREALSLEREAWAARATAAEESEALLRQDVRALQLHVCMLKDELRECDAAEEARRASQLAEAEWRTQLQQETETRSRECEQLQAECEQLRGSAAMMRAREARATDDTRRAEDAQVVARQTLLELEGEAERVAAELKDGQRLLEQRRSLGSLFGTPLSEAHGGVVTPSSYATPSSCTTPPCGVTRRPPHSSPSQPHTSGSPSSLLRDDSSSLFVVLRQQQKVGGVYGCTDVQRTHACERGAGRRAHLSPAAVLAAARAGQLLDGGGGGPACSSEDANGRDGNDETNVDHDVAPWRWVASAMAQLLHESPPQRHAMGLDDAARAKQMLRRAATANVEGDHAAARRSFEAAYVLQPRVSTLLSCANMLAKQAGGAAPLLAALAIYDELLVRSPLHHQRRHHAPRVQLSAKEHEVARRKRDEAASRLAAQREAATQLEARRTRLATRAEEATKTAASCAAALARSVAAHRAELCAMQAALCHAEDAWAQQPPPPPQDDAALKAAHALVDRQAAELAGLRQELDEAQSDAAQLSRALGAARRQHAREIKMRTAEQQPQPQPQGQGPAELRATQHAGERLAQQLSAMLHELGGSLQQLEAAAAHTEAEHLVAQQWRARRRELRAEMARKETELEQLRKLTRAPPDSPQRPTRTSGEPARSPRNIDLLHQFYQ